MLPPNYLPSLIAKKTGNKRYYYVVESARVQGQPRIVHQAYLGAAEKLAEMVRDRTAPVPWAACVREFGLQAALSGPPRNKPGLGCASLSVAHGPSPAHYVLLAALHQVCQPGPKSEVAEWYHQSILAALGDFAPERFTSHAFWDAFEQILPHEHQDLPPGARSLDKAQFALLGLWKEKQLVRRRLLVYDATNFYTYIASSKTRNPLAQLGHNNGRHNLRQIGLGYVLDGENGLSLCHHVYPGNVAEVEEFSTALARITRLLDQNQIARPDGHSGAGQRFDGAGQHCSLGRSPVGMDFRLAPEPGAGGIAQPSGRWSCRRAAAPNWGAGGSRENPGTWARSISLW